MNPRVSNFADKLAVGEYGAAPLGHLTRHQLLKFGKSFIA